MMRRRKVPISDETFIFEEINAKWPVYPAQFETREEVLRAVRESIASGLPEWMRA